LNNDGKKKKKEKKRKTKLVEYPFLLKIYRKIFFPSFSQRFLSVPRCGYVAMEFQGKESWLLETFIQELDMIPSR